MFDVKLLRENPDRLRAALRAKRSPVDLDQLIALDESRRHLTLRIDQLNTERNAASKAIGARHQGGRKPGGGKGGGPHAGRTDRGGRGGITRNPGTGSTSWR